MKNVHDFQTRTYKHQGREITPVSTQDVATSMTHQKYPFEPSHQHGIKEDRGNLNPIKRISPENQFSEWVIDQQHEFLQQYATKKKKNDKQYLIEKERHKTVELTRPITNPESAKWPQDDKFPYRQPCDNNNLRKRADNRQQAINRSYLDDFQLPEQAHNKSNFKSYDNE